ncbi:MAG: hypothetical protein ACREBR_01820, partial [bacterium]
NGVRGDIIGHGLSGSLTACPVRTLIRRVCYLRQCEAPVDTPLSSYRSQTSQCFVGVTAAQITVALRNAVAVMGHRHGLAPEDVSARSLRSSGAMALLCARVDADRIRLLGRWRSDEMFRYLHVQAYPIMRGFSRIMLDGGDYALIPRPEPHLPIRL